MFPVAAIYIFYAKKVLWLLKKSHKDLFKELGELGFLKNNTISNSYGFMRFLLLRQYRRLKNPELDSIANVSRLLLIAGLILFAITFITPIIIGNYN